jgi:23S rRNA pseudouridine2457 synthase
MPLILLNKPFRVLSQFTDDAGRHTLADWVTAPQVYPAGRLDYDSEGLLLLTDDGALQARISQPHSGLVKCYHVQVEGRAESDHLAQLLDGVTLKDGQASATHAELIDEPKELWPRDPPIRFRRAIPVSWVRLSINEGRNRQVRRMTAAVGLPTLRLIRVQVGPFRLDGLKPGESRSVNLEQAWQALDAWRG